MARLVKAVAILTWSGAVAAHLAHTQKVGGSSPPSATIFNCC